MKRMQAYKKQEQQALDEYNKFTRLGGHKCKIGLDK